MPWCQLQGERASGTLGRRESQSPFQTSSKMFVVGSNTIQNLPYIIPLHHTSIERKGRRAGTKR